MKTKLILFTLFLTVSAIAITILDTPIQFNAVEPSVFTVNIEKKYASTIVRPIAIDGKGNVLGKGDKLKPVILKSEELIPLSCMTIKELGLTATNNFAEVLHRAIMVGCGMEDNAVIFDWPTRYWTTVTNLMHLYDSDVNITNTTMIITNFYTYK